MTKKSRRAKSKYRVVATKRAGKPSQQPRSQPTGLQSSARIAPTAQDSPDRYKYVISEVKRIGVIAGAIILVLIILSIVLPLVQG